MDTVPTGPPEGTWQHDFGVAASINASRAFNYASNFAFDNPGVIAGASIGLLLCGTAMGLRIIWRKPKSKLRYVYNRVIRNPVSRFFGPVRRLHARWSRRNQRVQMAKWEKGHIADAFQNVLDQLCEDKKISRQKKRRLQGQLAVFFNLPDLARKKNHPHAVAERLKANEVSKHGPAKPIPGPKPGEDVVPLYKGLGNDYLSRKKVASA